MATKKDWLLWTDRLSKAAAPEDIFGKLADSAAEEREDKVKKIYRSISLIVHPDRCPADLKTKSDEAFGRLSDFYKQALDSIRINEYGKERAKAVIHGRKGDYSIKEPIACGGVTTVYRGENGSGDIGALAIKIVNSPGDNDLAENEAAVLRHLRAEPEKWVKEFHKYLPELLDSLMIAAQNRRANILALLDGYYSLREVKQQYPDGIEPRAMAWIWKRLLTILGFAHKKGKVHGAVIPPHIMINPKNHGLVLLDWSFAVDIAGKADSKIKAINIDYERFYPPEVFNKNPADPSTDIYMAAKCMVDVLGGDAKTKELPKSAPKEVRMFLRSCLLEEQVLRANKAWALYRDFLELLETLYGPPKFYEFYMPER